MVSWKGLQSLRSVVPLCSVAREEDRLLRAAGLALYEPNFVLVGPNGVETTLFVAAFQLAGNIFFVAVLVWLCPCRLG